MEEKAEIKQVSEREIWIGENKLYLDEDNIYYIVTVGDREEKENTLAIRVRGNRKLQNLSVKDFIFKLKLEIEEKKSWCAQNVLKVEDISIC